MTATIGGYEAEVIRLVAERGGRTPQEVVIGWFAPRARKARGKGRQDCCREVQCTRRGGRRSRNAD